MYTIKEIYKTIQGEGFHTGRRSVFVRFAGCNLWTGLEKDRAAAACSFCDTDFLGTDGPGGGKFKTSTDVVDKIFDVWDDEIQKPWVVFTGGEPALQLDEELVFQLRARGAQVAVETNGTLLLPDAIDWVCVSPKPGPALQITNGDELKLVYPQPELHPAQFDHLDFRHFSLQPLENESIDSNRRQAALFTASNPKWKLSLQVHKLVGFQ